MKLSPAQMRVLCEAYFYRHCYGRGMNALHHPCRPVNALIEKGYVAIEKGKQGHPLLITDKGNEYMIASMKDAAANLKGPDAEVVRDFLKKHAAALSEIAILPPEVTGG